MPIDFTKLSPPAATVRPVDPIALFRSLKVNDPAINDLWLAQGDALRDWHSTRNQSDIAIILNTGAGKTLVGLLAAQSLVNETSNQVAYACSSIQLVKQTADKARGYGLDVTTYYRGEYDNDLFRRGRAPCITTYHALFTGRSRFANNDITAVVFDDAHTAGHLLRDQFTLQIRRDSLPRLYSRVSQLFRPYFARIGQEMGYLETIEGHHHSAHRFIPPFAIRQVLAEVQRELLAAGLGDLNDTKFPWVYLRDHTDLCAVFISANDVVFTPVVVPVGILPYFRDGVRRLYLSATLAAKDEFLRSFGRVPNQIIAPTTAAGECERLILIPALAKGSGRNTTDIAAAKGVATSKKCLVLVPTYRRKTAWDEIATQFAEETAEQVERFKKADSPACLVLTARYDGVDLPGDSCRVMIIDDLPTGLNALERYLWEQLNLGKLLRSTIASRIVQSFGRISRGMSDHGVVLLTGDRLIEWILAPRNQALLPPFLQRQLQLGIDLSEMLALGDFADTADQCLNRDEGWISYYQTNMEALHPEPVPFEDLDQALEMSRAEVEFGQAFWERNFQYAAKVLETRLEATLNVSRATGAWHAFWLGYCYDLLGDSDRARHLYDRAHGSHKSLPPFERWFEAEEAGALPPQVLNVAAMLRSGNTAHLHLPRHLDMDLAALDGHGEVSHIEAALESLGAFLGLQASRPDNELGTGPDVVWSIDGSPALSIEAKTAKGSQATYSKRDLGQVRDHRQWVRDKLSIEHVFSTFIGPLVPPAGNSNPDPDIMVIELAQFQALGERLSAALRDICANGLPITATAVVHRIFHERDLLWPDLFDGLTKHTLQNVKPDGSQQLRNN